MKCNVYLHYECRLADALKIVLSSHFWCVHLTTRQFKWWINQNKKQTSLESKKGEIEIYLQFWLRNAVNTTQTKRWISKPFERSSSSLKIYAIAIWSIFSVLVILHWQFVSRSVKCAVEHVESLEFFPIHLDTCPSFSNILQHFLEFLDYWGIEQHLHGQNNEKINHTNRKSTFIRINWKEIDTISKYISESFHLLLCITHVDHFQLKWLQR